MKNKIAGYLLPGLMIVFGFLAWFSLYRAVDVPGSSTWSVPILAFSVFAIFICLSAVLGHSTMLVEFAVILSFLSSLLFSFSLWHFIFLALSLLLMLKAVMNIRKDLDLNVKISLWKSLGTGKFSLVLSLSILITSQYFFILKNSDAEKHIPKFDIGEASTKLAEPILAAINPNFKKIQQEDLTVDQFIMETQAKNMENVLLDEKAIEVQLPENISPKQKELLVKEVQKQMADSGLQLAEENKELVLTEGRRQLSQMIGTNIVGSEKIADVFAGFIDKKINDFFQHGIRENSDPDLLSYVFAAILFLTIWPLGSLLGYVCFALVIIIFKIFVSCGLVEIKRITVEREMIV